MKTVSYSDVGPRSVEVLVSGGGRVRRIAELFRGKKCWWLITDAGCGPLVSLPAGLRSLHEALGVDVIAPEVRP